MNAIAKRPWGESLIGNSFGRLIVLEKGNKKNGHRYWICKCECGNKKEISHGALKSGNTKSCGCIRKEVATKASATLNLKAKPRKDITSKRFGSLVAVAINGKSKNGKNVWKCICDCGATTYVPVGDLSSGNSKSCGCKTKDALRNYVQEKKKNAVKSPHLKAANIWKKMISRCYDQLNKDFPNYGGRGISVCDQWMDFKSFFNDMGDPPDGMSIDRIDNNGNYEPSNCRWATSTEQARNKRNNVIVEYKGERMTVAEASIKSGIPASTIYSRVTKLLSTYAGRKELDDVMAKVVGFL